jgi:hypothetical protein
MIYDCFPFFNELELLELRMNELDGLVDKFVLVEATKTFQGSPKPLHFAENRERFSAFEDKIIHVVVDDMPEGDGPRDHWVRDRFQRNAIGRGLVNCKPQDIIMVSDLDEIPNVQTVERFCAAMTYRDDFFSNALHTLFNNRVTRFIFHRKTLRHPLRRHYPFVWKLEQYPCWYFLNRRIREMKWWYGTKIMHFRDFSIAEEMRHSGYKIIKNGGWHFSFMGDANRIRTKIAATAHQEINTPEGIRGAMQCTTIEHVALELQQGTVELVPLDELPGYVKAHPEQFKSWLIDPDQLPR